MNYEAQASAQLGRNTISPADPLDNLEGTLRELSGRIASCRQRLAVNCLLEWASTLRQEVELLELQLDRIS